MATIKEYLDGRKAFEMRNENGTPCFEIIDDMVKYNKPKYADGKTKHTAGGEFKTSWTADEKLAQSIARRLEIPAAGLLASTDVGAPKKQGSSASAKVTMPDCVRQVLMTRLMDYLKDGETPPEEFVTFCGADEQMSIVMNKLNVLFEAGLTGEALANGMATLLKQ